MALLAFAVMGLTSFMGCDGTDASGVERPSRAAEGPLQGPGSDGLVSIFEPVGQANWSATFGSVLLCVDVPSGVAITKVTYDVETKPVDLHTLLRRVPEGDAQKADREWSPIASRVGGRNYFLKPSSPMGGEFETRLAGQEVNVDCDTPGNGSYVEILTVMDVDARGGQTNDVRVEYDSDQGHFTLVVPLTFVACGHEVEASRAC